MLILNNEEFKQGNKVFFDNTQVKQIDVIQDNSSPITVWKYGSFTINVTNNFSNGLQIKKNGELIDTIYTPIVKEYDAVPGDNINLVYNGVSHYSVSINGPVKVKATYLDNWIFELSYTCNSPSENNYIINIYANSNKLLFISGRAYLYNNYGSEIDRYREFTGAYVLNNYQLKIVKTTTLYSILVMVGFAGYINYAGATHALTRNFQASFIPNGSPSSDIFFRNTEDFISVSNY